jgi:hypothetical protein
VGQVEDPAKHCLQFQLASIAFEQLLDGSRFFAFRTILAIQGADHHIKAFK